MSMAYRELLLCFTILFHQSASEAFVTVISKPGNVGHYGQPSVVECIVERSEEAKDAKLTAVYWMKVDNPQKPVKLLVFEDGNVKPTPGYAFADPSWSENMNVSLLISNTVISDSGDYKCLVFTESGHDHGLTNLSVLAKYVKPKITQEKSPVKEDNTLVCSSEGGFPQAELNWYDKNGNKVDGQKEAKQEENGLYTLTNKLTWKQDSGTYTCKVVSAGGGEAEMDHDLKTSFPENSKRGAQTEEPKLSPAQIVAPLVVIGSLIVGLLLLILYKKRRTQARRPSAAPLMGSNEPAEANTTYSAPDEYDSEDETTNTRQPEPEC